MTTLRSARLTATAAVFSVLPFTMIACSSGPGATTEDASPAVIASPVSSGGVSIEPWEYEGDRGQLLRTPNYRIHSTLRPSVLLDRIPSFMEMALGHYTSSLVQLPLPPRSLDSFIFAERAQWEDFTEEIMGSKATTYLRIGRGGFSTGGRAVLYDIGTFDTLAIAAHEGWHQYSQRTFEDTLPIWMEEGVAAFMEGHRFVDDEPVFVPWSNPERYFQLRRTSYRRRLLPLATLLETQPEEALAQSNTAALEYYAQVWTLVHFLNEGEGGIYRPRLQMMLRDAANGHLEQRVRATFRERGYGSRSVDTRSGPDVFIAYFSADLDAVNEQYQRFISQLVSRQSRRRFVRGDSPIETNTE